MFFTTADAWHCIRIIDETVLVLESVAGDDPSEVAARLLLAAKEKQDLEWRLHFPPYRGELTVGGDHRVRPVIVFGISGASWRVIEAMASAGQLPNIRRLRSDGSSGVLRSVRAVGDQHFRPQVAWPTLASGVRPERHGITRFFDDARDAKVPMLWDVYQQHAVKVGLFGWPMTWPPKQVDGFDIPSHLARDTQTWPPELSFIKSLDRQEQNAERGGKNPGALTKLQLGKALLAQGVGARSVARLGTTFSRVLVTRDPEQRALLLRHAKLDLSANLFLCLARRYGTGFSAFTTFLVDLVSHRYWRYREPELFAEPLSASSSQFRTAVADAYAHVDRVIGRVLSAAPRDAIFTVVSEHGMAAEPESAEVGRWRYVIRGESLHELVGLDASVHVCPVARWVAFRFAADRGLQQRVAAQMRRVIVEQTGLPLFQVHLHADDEVVVKFNLHRDIDAYRHGDLEKLTIRYEDRVVPFAALTKRLGRQRSGMHDGDGVLIMRGPGIIAGGDLPDAQLVDFMPTLLHASGLQVPEHVDGVVLNIFERLHGA